MGTIITSHIIVNMPFSNSKQLTLCDRACIFIKYFLQRYSRLSFNVDKLMWLRESISTSLIPGNIALTALF